MKVQSIFIFLILLFSCNQQGSEIPKTETDSKFLHIDQLAERYLELGRFSGSILISDTSDIIFLKNFGYSDHLGKTPFTENSTFKIGSLSTFYIEQILRTELNKKNIDLNSLLSKFIKTYTQDLRIIDLLDNQNVAENRKLIKVLVNNICSTSIEKLFQQYCNKWNLDNTYYQSISGTESIGHLYINKGNGLEWTPSPVIESDSVSIFNGIKSNPKDLMKIVNANSIKHLNTDGYMMQDGFSFSVQQKNKKTIIVFSNTRHPVGLEITESIEAILNEEDYDLPLRRIEIELNKNTLYKYQGEYKMGEEMMITIKLSNDSLFTFMGPKKIHLLPQSENQFYMKQSDAGIKFITDKKGKVTGAMMLDGFLKGRIIDKIK